MGQGGSGPNNSLRLCFEMYQIVVLIHIMSFNSYHDTILQLDQTEIHKQICTYGFIAIPPRASSL